MPQWTACAAPQTWLPIQISTDIAVARNTSCDNETK